MTPGSLAALEVGQVFGIRSDDPVVIQETNNTVVWLRPHPVIAKVGTRTDSVEGVIREHEVAAALRALGAPVAEPLTDSHPVRHPATGFTVTLWRRLDHDPTARVSGAMVASSLRQVHDALAVCGITLPDFRLGLQRARAALSDDVKMAALPAGDIALLREAFDGLLPRLESRSTSQYALHGEPHDGNRRSTSSGIRWIDLESVCLGPLEWDLAFLSDDARREFANVDHGLLTLLSMLNSARVATWCWIESSARFREMRRHGQLHLDLLRAQWRKGQ